MTIIVWFRQSDYRTFKDYYCKEVSRHLRDEFPKTVSYNRFVELMPKTLVLGRYRRMSKDYEYLTESSDAMLYAAMIRLMLKRLAQASAETG